MLLMYIQQLTLDCALLLLYISLQALQFSFFRIWLCDVSGALLLQMEHCMRNVWALHRPICWPPGCTSHPLRRPEAGCLSCLTWWEVTAPRHHIPDTYPQLYISCKIMLVLSLPLSSLNFLDSKDLGPMWILVL
jgi:hypothetical protein